MNDAGLAAVASAIADPRVLARLAGAPVQASDQVTSQTTIPVGIYWNPGIWDLARSAYVADLDTDPKSPGAFVGWLAQALELHARLSPQQRADLPASTIEAVEDAVVADCQELGRVLARSAFAQEAVIAAADEARRRLGRELPPPPQTLSN